MVFKDLSTPFGRNHVHRHNEKLKKNHRKQYNSHSSQNLILKMTLHFLSRLSFNKIKDFIQ